MTTITITIWHSVARDQHDRPTAMPEGYHPGDPAVRVFTYQADPAGRTPEQIAEEAFAICNGHPHDARGALARALNVLTIENDDLRRKASRTGRLMAPSPLTPVTSDVSQLASRGGPAGVPSRLSP